MNNDIRWSIDLAHSEITFKIKHLKILNVRGMFRTFDASIYTKGIDFSTAEIDLWIDSDSINTNDVKRDEHLRSPDFFDVQRYKQISFRSNTIGKIRPGSDQELWGELTIKGITKKIILNLEFGGIVKDPSGKERAGLKVTGKLNRKDWGLDWNSPLETGDVLLNDDVSILCELELRNEGNRYLEMELQSLEDRSILPHLQQGGH